MNERLKDSTKDGRDIYIRRHLSNGSVALCRCHISTLGPEDYDAAVRLHDEVAHGLSQEIYCPSSHEELRRYLSDDGLAIGVWNEEKLVSLRTIKMDDDWARYTCETFGVECLPEERPATTGFCVVDREFRGNNVQFLTQYLAEGRVSEEHTSLITTVAPKNIFSLDNVLKCNFRIIGLKKVYGGFLRFVLMKAFRPGLTPLWTHGHLQIPIRDKKRQLDALANGFCGYRLIRKPSGFHILYAKVSETEPAAV